MGFFFSAGSSFRLFTPIICHCFDIADSASRNLNIFHLSLARAASTIYQMMSVKREIDREQLKPLLIRNTIPLCMAQYERVFGTSRVPGKEFDTLVTRAKIKVSM